MMSRQAYFYRVPPQELHRRNQSQSDPTKTKALQTVIDMKVWPHLLRHQHRTTPHWTVPHPDAAQAGRTDPVSDTDIEVWPYLKCNVTNWTHHWISNFRSGDGVAAVVSLVLCGIGKVYLGTVSGQDSVLTKFLRVICLHWG